MTLEDRDGNELETGFYYDVLSTDPDLRYVIVVIKTDQEVYFDAETHPMRINCLSPETQASRIIPLSRESHPYLFLNEKFLEWMRKRVEEHPSLKDILIE